MINIILTNLSHVGIAIALLAVAWLANFALSLYYNISVLQENWNRKKFITGAARLGAVCIGIALLTVVITALPVFFDYVGINLPDGTTDAVNIIVIITLFAYTAIKYVKDAVDTLKGILNYGGGENNA